MLGASGKRIGGFRGPFGVQVDIAAGLLQLVILIVLAAGVLRGDVFFAVLIVAMITVSIFLHELGHAVAALIQGVRVHRIVLHGFGGYCAHAATGPRQQLLIVLGGPAVNLALWLLSEPLAVQFRETRMTDQGVILIDTQMSYMVGLFGRMNLLLLIFNMLPVLPLDGGRTFFLCLWFFLSRDIAMRITGLVGTIIAVLWIPAAILLFLLYGMLLLFFPSIRENWRRFKGEQTN
jgi:Zn-dependent protease